MLHHLDKKMDEMKDGMEKIKEELKDEMNKIREEFKAEINGLKKGKAVEEAPAPSPRLSVNIPHCQNIGSIQMDNHLSMLVPPTCWPMQF
jgi:hypothetical protein